MNIDPHVRRALLLLGCPEIPVQTSLAIYMLNLLNARGADVMTAGNTAALELVTTADPARCYVKDTADLDETIGDLAGKKTDADICYVFIHNDAGISYLATAAALVGGEAVGIIFGQEAQSLSEQCSELKLRHIWARAVHNPRPLKSKIEQEVERWAASSR